MPAAMNLQPAKAEALVGLAKHAFREYAPDAMPKHVVPEWTKLNQLLCGDRTALDDLPARQPDTGRKIRSDANRVASMVCTLPKELDPTDLDEIRKWTRATVEWLEKDCPGTVAWAVLHLDEARPHLHAAVVPENADRHLSYREHFGSPAKLRALQNSYSKALKPLGVEPHTELEKAARRPRYTKGVDGWRVGRAVLDAHDLVRHEQQRVAALNAQARILECPEQRLDAPGLFTPAKTVHAKAEALLRAKDLRIRELEDRVAQLDGRLNWARSDQQGMKSHVRTLDFVRDRNRDEIKALREVVRTAAKALPAPARAMLDETMDRLGLAKEEVLGRERDKDLGL